MNNNTKKILLIFIEPTPYILDLVSQDFDEYHHRLEVIFLKNNLTQQWGLTANVCKNPVLIFYKIFIQRKYALVHVAGWSQPICLLIILLSRIFLVPVVVESDTQINPNLTRLKKIIKRVLFPILFRFPRGFLPGGTRQKKYLAHYGVGDYKMIKANMTVDTEKISRYTSSIPNDERCMIRKQYKADEHDVVFLYVGRLLDWKGIRELLAAIKKFDNYRVKVWIAGDGELAEEVREAEKNNNRVHYLGRVSGDLLWKIYHAADVFVLPSHAEPWGLVVNEAMAAGKPVIVTNAVGCVDDLVTHQKEGLIIKPKNITALSDAMQYVLDQPYQRETMGFNAKNRIASWTLQNEARNIIEGWRVFGA
ncbi:MAG: hypothetical protein A3F12_00710 [Gammaproteobacteria bacterium RIFCSPHIGHO2_12_FULL_38_14]|nr:MAG: hypothetical protein A3F12_00710 [Gammaproteobacteria bacterium RIFCSPHIGHO2_12_FULL_38_14]